MTKENKSNTHKNKQKERTCDKYVDLLYILYEIGKGVMLQAQLVRFVEQYLGMSESSLKCYLKELEANLILETQKYNNRNLIVLKKYGYRYFRQQEAGVHLQSKDFSRPKVTSLRIKKSIYICEYILVLCRNKTDIHDTINLIKSSTTLLDSKSTQITYFNNLITDDTIPLKARKQLHTAVLEANTKINTTSTQLSKESANKKDTQAIRTNETRKDKEERLRNMKDKKYEKAKERKFNLNCLLENSLYLTKVSKEQINIVNLNFSDALTIEKIESQIVTLHKYFIKDLLSYVHDKKKELILTDTKLNLDFIFSTHNKTTYYLYAIKDKHNMLLKKYNTNTLTKEEKELLLALQTLNVNCKTLNVNNYLLINGSIPLN